MELKDDAGRPVDATFSLEPASSGFDLILESRGGSDDGPTKSRNSQYAEGMEILLGRLAGINAVLVDVLLDSRPVRTRSDEKRRLATPNFRLPLRLSDVVDLSELRLEFGRASAAFGRADGASGGNSTKRLRIRLRLPPTTDLPLKDIAAFLAGGKPGAGARHEHKYAPLGAYLRGQDAAELRLTLGEIARMVGPLPADARTRQFWANAAGHHPTRRNQWLSAGYQAYFEPEREAVRFERAGPQSDFSDNADQGAEAPTDDPETLAERVEIARKRIRSSGTGEPPPGSEAGVRTKGSTYRFQRDPKVVAWVLEAAKGICEVCGGPAPFKTSEGEPYLEVHHVRFLAEGGPDTTDNAVAACPNCHRRLHHGSDRDVLRSTIISKIIRLVDYPSKKVIDLPSEDDGNSEEVPD